MSKLHGNYMFNRPLTINGEQKSLRGEKLMSKLHGNYMFLASLAEPLWVQKMVD